MVHSTAGGHIEGFSTNGWCATALILNGVFWISRVKGSGAQDVAGTDIT